MARVPGSSSFFTAGNCNVVALASSRLDFSAQGSSRPGSAPRALPPASAKLDVAPQVDKTGLAPATRMLLFAPSVLTGREQDFPGLAPAVREGALVRLDFEPQSEPALAPATPALLATCRREKESLSQKIWTLLSGAGKCQLGIVWPNTNLDCYQRQKDK